MKRIERIDEILKKIREEWIDNSDMRLGQLLISKFDYPDGFHWFTEDDVFDIELYDNGEKSINQDIQASKKKNQEKKQLHRIYVAGPYNPTNCTLHEAPKVVQCNVDKVIEVANKLIEKGHYVCVPHLGHYLSIHPSNKRNDKDWWYEEDFSFLKHWATAVYYVGASYGADLELEYAKHIGLKIFYNLDEVPDGPDSNMNRFKDANEQ